MLRAVGNPDYRPPTAVTRPANTPVGTGRSRMVVICHLSASQAVDQH